MIFDKPTYISLFSSAGVGCFGFKQAGFECVATNEYIERRLNIQRINKKCKYESGYISGDIKDNTVKKAIFDEIEHWKSKGNDGIDVVIATPPCQGMSVANHKKNNKDLDRNSLVTESIKLVKEINPKFFIFENVAAFWKTGCKSPDGNIVEIGKVVNQELGASFEISHRIINFKDYGSNSSRTRTLVIGVNKTFEDDVSSIELFPDYMKAKTLEEVIGDFKSLRWGEYDKNDFYHSFRIYPKRMEAWIENLNEGQSAFENVDIMRKPHQVINGEIVINKSKNGDKYRRQIWNKVAPCIHTRNDQLASQNTIHPVDNRVFSIRELMCLMTIPYEFKWIELSLENLNSLSDDEKYKVSKANEMNIRQSIGEAVPTNIFFQIAKKIGEFLSKKNLDRNKVLSLIDEKNLYNYDNLKKFIEEYKSFYNMSTLTRIIELSNNLRSEHSAYYTNKAIITEIFSLLPDINKDCIDIIEPSIGAGNFLPFIFKRYEDKLDIKLKVFDIDDKIIDLVKLIWSDKIPDNVSIEYINQDFLDYKGEEVDLIVGNPPFTKIKGIYRKNKLVDNYNKKATNLAEFFLEKALKYSRLISFVMPKNLLNTPEYDDTRRLLTNFNINSIIDFGEKGFKGVLVETINIIIGKDTNDMHKIIIKSLPQNTYAIKKSTYIMDKNFPYWIIYRDNLFDQVADKMHFGIFEVFRDRQLTNSLMSDFELPNSIWVLKSQNISKSGEIIHIDKYDRYINKDKIHNLAIGRFCERSDVFLTPNLSYSPRLVKKPKGVVCNGSLAVLIPKTRIKITREHMDYISSEEFKEFYFRARNYQTRSLNIDSNSVFWFGINKEVNINGEI